MTLYEIIFLIMFAIFIVVMGVVACAECWACRKTKDLSRTIELYERDLNSIRADLEAQGTAIKWLDDKVDKLDTRYFKLNWKEMNYRVEQVKTKKGDKDNV